MNRLLIIAIVIAPVIVGGLGFTKPGHRALASLGFAAACGSSDGCSD